MEVMSMKRIALILLVLVTAVSFAACNAEDSGSFGVTGRSPGSFSDSEELRANSYGGEGYVSNKAAPAAPMSNADPEASEDLRKIIRNASLDMEAKDASELFAKLTAYCSEQGGYEFSSDVKHYETYTVISATLKLPPRALESFIAYAGEHGTVINSKTDSQDVTEEFYDIQTRLETKRRSLEQYYALLGNADTIDDILKLQRIIDDLTEDIEASEGRLRLLDGLSDMATVRILIRQENDPITIRREIDWSALSLGDMGYLIQYGFVSLMGVVVTALQWLVIVLAVTSPLWLTAGIIVCVVIRRGKKKKAPR